jgi:hypothetical protein
LDSNDTLSIVRPGVLFLHPNADYCPVVDVGFVPMTGEHAMVNNVFGMEVAFVHITTIKTQLTSSLVAFPYSSIETGLEGASSSLRKSREESWNRVNAVILYDGVNSVRRHTKHVIVDCDGTSISPPPCSLDVVRELGFDKPSLSPEILIDCINAV